MPLTPPASLIAGGRGFRAALHLVADRGDRAGHRPGDGDGDVLGQGRRRVSADRATPASDRITMLRMVGSSLDAGPFSPPARGVVGSCVGHGLAGNAGDGNRAAALAQPVGVQRILSVGSPDCALKPRVTASKPSRS